jgi:hypothetical protein
MELRVPILKKPGRSIFKTSPESLRKWVENLPLVNVETSVGQLEFGLSEINSVEMSFHDRLEALELLTAPVMHVAGALHKKYLGKRFPLGKGDLNRSNQAIGLYLAMATGYKLLVTVLDRETNADPRIALPMQRAIRYLSETLIGSYQIYSTLREGIWTDLHTLYALSVKHGLQAHQEIDTTLQNPAQITAETAYKQILLLSLAGPYRLRQGEIRLVYNLLGRWAPYSRLHAAKDHDNIGFFTCHLTSDDPPCYLLLRQRDRLDGDWRILDTSGMTEPANATLAELHATPSLRNIFPGENTLKRLMLAWGVMPERKTRRTRQEAPIQLVLGINAIHRLLAEPGLDDGGAAIRETPTRDVEDFLQDPTLERPTMITTTHPSRGKTASGGDRQNNRFMSAVNHPMRGAFALEVQSRSNGGKQTLPIESWKMVDVSAGGYCMLWESNDVSSAQVGELVAIRVGAEGSNDGWKLGVIRWMKFTPERGLVLGVQLMASGATPVWACLCSDTSAAENKAQGILLPESRTLNQQPSLLLPSMPFRTGCLSTLSIGGKKEWIMLVRQIENTGSFAQFHFTSATDS